MVAEQNSKQKLFPNFMYSPDMGESDVFLAISTKWAQRMIMQGGPFIEPSQFYFLQPPDDLRTNLESEFRGPLDDKSLDSQFVNESNAISIDGAVEGIINGTVAMPVVFKPNIYAFGEGIYFIERGDGRTFQVTMRAFKGAMDQRRPFGVLKYISSELGFADEGDVYKAFFSGDKRELFNVLRKIMVYGTLTKLPYISPDTGGVDSGDFDPGLLESFINSWKLDGRAYETRHMVKGNLAKRTVLEVKDHHARIGASRYFSNQTDARNPSETKRLLGDEMYAPLFKAFIPPSERGRFLSGVRVTLEKGFHHYAERIYNEGFIFDSSANMLIDLMWLPPLQKNDFPKPAMTECTLMLDKLNPKLKYRFR